MKKSLLTLFLLANAALGYSQISFSALSTSNITDTTASLNAYVNVNNCPNGGSFHAQYSTSPSFATVMNASGGSSSISFARTINILGLTPGTTYYWRYYGYLGLNCNQSTIFSPTQTFTTTNTVPTVPTISNITVNGGIIGYTLTPNNGATTSVVRYGLAANNLSNSTPGHGATAGSANSGTIDLSGVLTDGTTYFYQIEATNSAGTTTSAVASFYYGTTTPHYTFDNTYNNINGTNPFSSNSGTSFTTDRNGNANGALNINNTGSTANISGLPSGSSPRTVSLWVKVNSFNANYNFLYCFGNNVNFNGTYITSTTIYHFGTGGNHSLPNAISSSWNHFVFTYDGTNSKIYKNGALLGTLARTWNSAAVTTFSLGLTENSEQNYFNGAIDDLKIYNFAVSDADVSSLYTNNTLSTEELESKNLNAVIYPNPASENFNIAMDNEVKSVEIYSLQGQKVLASDQKSIEISGLSKGIYLIRIEDENSAVSTQKLIIK